MKKTIELCKEGSLGCAIENSVDSNIAVLRFCRERGKVLIAADKTEMGSIAWADAKYIVFDVYNPQLCEEVFFIEFWEKNREEQSLCMSKKLFPLVKARIVFDLKLLNSQVLFPALTPGSLKGTVSGNSIDISKMDKAAVGLCEGFFDNRSLEVFDVYLTDEYPEFLEAEKINTDCLGQWKEKDWKGKISNISELKDKLEDELSEHKNDSFSDVWDEYGGYRGLKLAGEGYFRVMKNSSRWWLVDPNGYAFFSTGVFGVYSGEPCWVHGNEGYHEWLPQRDEYKEAWTKAEDMELFRRKFHGMFPKDTALFSFATANLIRAFGSSWEEKWSDLTNSRLRRFGINTLSMFSDKKFIEKSKLPFVIMLEGFPTTKQKLFREMPDIYSLEYEENSHSFALQLEAYSANCQMIGYFLNNEPTWGFVHGLILAEKVLEMKNESFTKNALIAFLSERYAGSIEKLNIEWRLKLSDFNELLNPIERASELSETAKMDLEDFSFEMILRYARIPSEWAKKYAPNHLNLGMRFAKLDNRAIIETSRYFDVFSFNCYRDNPFEMMDLIASFTDKPILIGEFHFGALDRGLPSPSLFGVASQEERAAAYSRYVDAVAFHQNGVGAHYFAYNDQPLWGRYDGENYQFGFVDVCNLPYAEFTEGVLRTNRTIYDLLCKKRKPLGGKTVKI